MYKVNYYYSNIKSFFHNDNPKETVGIIGYLRGDFASRGEEFHTTWFDVHEELKTLNFKTEIDDVINELRKGILKDRSSMKKVFSNHPNCVMNSEAGISRGVFVETEHYEYAFRLIGDKGNYDFYCYCADKNVQPPHLRNARRFRDENGQLAKTIEEVSKLTQAEALNYYTDGDRYESGGNIYTFRKSGMHMSFVSETGGETEVHPDKLGTFLPDVEYLGMSFTKVPLKQTLSTLKLKDLMQSVEFKDVHLVHADEDIDLATVAELNKNTLTQEGKYAWSDVLNARVTKVYEGAYGMQIECSDIEPQRLSEFSHMLAGNCSSRDFDKWVNPDTGQEQDIKM